MPTDPLQVRGTLTVGGSLEVGGELLLAWAASGRRAAERGDAERDDSPLYLSSRLSRGQTGNLTLSRTSHRQRHLLSAKIRARRVCVAQTSQREITMLRL